MQAKIMPHNFCSSPLGWVGGKTRLRPTIISVLHEHKVYCETFFGSGSIFFGKFPSHYEFINDINGEVVNLMKVISGTYFDESIRQEFIGYVRTLPASREVFEDWKKWDADKLGKLTPAQRAYRFYYCVKKSFSSTITGGYEASPFGSSRLNMNTDFEPFAARFRARNAQIECMDFIEFIDKYNKAGAGVQFLCDPPYFVANDTNYYEYTFTPEQHVQLKECCDKIHKEGNWFLNTYDDCPEVIDLYKDYYLYRTDPVCYKSAEVLGGKDMYKQELFITNYDICKMVLDRSDDIFAEVDARDKRIEIPGHIGLERIN